MSSLGVLLAGASLVVPYARLGGWDSLYAWLGLSVGAGRSPALGETVGDCAVDVALCRPSVPHCKISAPGRTYPARGTDLAV
ncbi:hypothetical protein [Streptomyces sp. TE5632]